VTDQAGPSNFLEFVRERRPGLFAHHPAHPAFGEHVWTFGGVSFCKGCSVTFAGMLAGGLLQLSTGWLRHLSDVQLGLAFAALLLPTILTTLLEAPRSLRHAARFLLGILLASALVVLVVTDSWVVRAAIVLAYLAVRIPLDRRRRRGNAQLVERWTQLHNPK
jgi:hypothetical protein